MDDEFPEDLLNRTLTKDEKLLWSGYPRQGLGLRASDWLLIPFSLLWCGFALFWEISAISMNAPWLFKLWGIPFVLVGLYLVFGRFIADAVRRRRTVYGVTSSRVIIASGRRGRSVKSVTIRNLPEISLREHSDGTGDIILGRPVFASQTTSQDWEESPTVGLPILEGIPQARTVHDLIVRIQHDAH